MIGPVDSCSPGRRAVFVALAALAAVVLMGILAVRAAEADDAVTLSFETEGAYTLGPGDSKDAARRLALSRAKRKAAEQAADQFARRRLIQFEDRDKNELVHLVAEQLKPDRLQEQFRPRGRTTVCSVRVHTVVRLSDFIDAQLASLRLGAYEDGSDYHHEMEPEIPSPLKPEQALAKASRLIGKHEPRMAIIYLDRLADHYPNWWEIYELKARALGLQNRPAKMLEALRKACELGGPRDCDELK